MKNTPWTLERKIMAGFAGMAAMMALIILLVISQRNQRRQAQTWVTHTLLVKEGLSETYAHVAAAESDARAYAIQNDPSLAERYEQSKRESLAGLARLTALMADNPVQSAGIVRLADLVRQKIAFCDRILQTVQREGPPSGRELIANRDGVVLMREISLLVSELRGEEDRLLAARTLRSDAEEARAWWALAALAGVSILTVVGNYLLIRFNLAERKHAEEERDRFFTLSLDLMCMASPKGYFARVNPSFTRILGWSEQEILSRPFREFLHPDDLAATSQAVTHLYEGRRLNMLQNRYRCKDGGWKLIWWTSTADAKGARRKS